MDTAEPPAVLVTIDQVVALNVRYWRRTARLTQEELGERIGWTAANISAAERSADPGRDKRRFDAQTLVALARALELPVAALLLPPPGDGITARHEFQAGGECLGMSDLVSLLVSEPSQDETPVMSEYRDRYVMTLATYLDPERGADLGSYLGDLTDAGMRALRVQRLQWQREALAALVGDIDQITAAIEAAP